MKLNRFVIFYAISLLLGPLSMAVVASVFTNNSIAIHFGLLCLSIYFFLLSFLGIRNFTAGPKTFFHRRFIVILWTLGLCSFGGIFYFLKILMAKIFEI